MSYPKDELPPPGAAHDDARSFELLRVWFAAGVPHAAPRADLWPDPAAWGIVLAEAARQLARMCAADVMDGGEDAVLARLRAGFDEELRGHAPGSAGEPHA